MSAALAGCLHGGTTVHGAPQTPVPAEDWPIMERLRSQVTGEMERLRQQILDADLGMDRGPLLERKLTVDGSLVPALLLEDATAFCEAVRAGREPPDLLRALRVEYAGAPVRAAWSHPDGPRRVERALAGWVPGAGGMVACVATTRSLRAPRGEGAPLIRWTAVVEGAASERQVRACAHWYEPCLEQSFLDWPLSPLGLELTWDDSGGALSQAGVSHGETWPARAVFNNPGDLYALFDALRLRRAADTEVRSDAGAASDARVDPGVGQEPGRAASIARTIRREDGSMVRREAWHFEDGRLRALVIEQPALRLRHVSAQAFDMEARISDEVAATTTVRAESVVAHPPGGMRIVVRFRSADPARDALPVVEGVTVPEVVLIEAGGTLRMRAEIEGVAAGGDAEGRRRAAAIVAGWKQSADSGKVLRQRAMDTVERAVAKGDARAIRGELAHLARLGGAEGVPPEWALANAAFARRRLARAGHEDAAADLHGWTVRAFLAGDDPVDTPTSEMSSEREAVAAAIAEGLRALVGRSGDLLDASAQEALASRERARTAARRLGLAAREVLRQAPPAADAWCARAAPWMAEDVRALAAARVGELGDAALTDEASLDRACEAFAARIWRAMEHPWPDEDTRAASRAAVRTAATAAGAVARAAAVTRGEADSTAESVGRRTERSVRARAGLAANGLLPASPAGEACLRSVAEWTTVLSESEVLAQRLMAFDAFRAAEAERRAAPLLDARFAPPLSPQERQLEDLANAVAEAAAGELARVGLGP
jgi:hypothetical protein